MRPTILPPAPIGWRLDAAAVLLTFSTGLAILAFLFFAGCMPARHAEAAILSGANAAIVAAATEIDAIERAEEAACDAGPREQLAACVRHARRWNDALRAYDAWRLAWAALRTAWDGGAEAEVAKAEVAAEAARAGFWAAKAVAQIGGGR